MPAGREGGVLLGAEDFAQSTEALSRILSAPVTRLVRGHDGAPEGFRWFRHCGEGAVLTVTTMADRVERASATARRCPCLARLKRGTIRVVRIEIPEDLCLLCEQLFPRRATDAPRTSNTTSPAAAETSAVAKDATPTHVSPPMQGAPPPTDPKASHDPAEATARFERGVRLLVARAWGGALECFEQSAGHAPLRTSALLNASVACLWMGPSRHQETLARLREVLHHAPRDAAALFNLGVALLVGERNPIDAIRALRSAIDADSGLADAWWALGLALAMRSDAAGAASAFARAADCGCPLSAPGSLHGLVPARELAPALDALRGMARHRPAPGSPAVRVG